MKLGSFNATYGAFSFGGPAVATFLLHAGEVVDFDGRGVQIPNVCGGRFSSEKFLRSANE